MPVFPSLEWLKELSDRMNRNKEYEEVGKSWEQGAFILHCTAEEGKLKDDVIMYIKPHKGKILEVAQLKSLDDREAEFTLTAPYSVWKEIVQGKTDGIKALMQGRIILKGDMAVLLRDVRPSQVIIKEMKFVETKFIDEL
jgi:putative sterol carrier protein